MADGTILVTGGAGFIGSHVVRRLWRGGARLRVLELPGVRVDHLPQPRVEIIRGDVRDAESMREAVRGCAHVIHLAADPNLWARRPRQFDEVNHRGTRIVLEAAQRESVQRVVHVSTESILTSPRSGDSLNEQTPLRLENALGPYCRSKMRAEMAAQEYAQRGLPVVIVSPTVPVGPGDHRRGPLTRLICQFAAGSIRGLMDAEINLIDVRDVADGIVAAARRGVPGRRYLLAGEIWPVREIFQTLSEWTGTRVPRFRVPPLVALLFAWLEEQYCRVATNRIPMATVTGVRLACRSQRFDGSASIAELGLQLRPCLDGLREEVQWLGLQGAIRLPLPGIRSYRSPDVAATAAGMLRAAAGDVIAISASPKPPRE